MSRRKGSQHVSATWSLGSIALDPCSRNGDGAIRRPSRLRLGLQTDANQPEQPCRFAAAVAGEVLNCTIEPLGEGADVPSWSGQARLSGFRIDPPRGEDTSARVAARLVLHAETPSAEPGIESVETFGALFALRASMASIGAVSARVSMRVAQPGLDFPDEGEGDELEAEEPPTPSAGRRRRGKGSGS